MLEQSPEKPKKIYFEGALPGQFCRSHIVTAENPEGNDCSTWLVEGKGTICPYNSPEEALKGIDPKPEADGVCRDFKLRDFGPDSDWTLKFRDPDS